MRPSLARLVAVVGALTLLTPAARAHGQATPGGTQPPSTISVYLDCGYRCDEDFLHTEIAYVNWVRDRAVSDVHVLVTTQPTGGSGTEYTIAFLGQRPFAGVGDTLRYVAPATNSQDDTRKGIARTIAMGLVPFLARTSAAERLSVTVAAPAAGAAAQSTRAHDPWNYWTFRLSGNTNFNGERSYEDRNYHSTVNANRTTAAWKTSFNLNQNQNSSRFVYEDPLTGDRTTTRSYSRSATLSNLTVKSLTEHWSAGLRGAVSSSTYLNQRITWRALPAVEYDLFPYAQSTRRQLRFQYGIGVQDLNYKDTTIYGKIEETKPIQSGQVALDLRQPWGSVSFSVDGQQYLDAPKYYDWSFFTNANLRLFRGFSLNFFGGYERLRDQIYLSARGVSRDEILLRQRQLETGFNYFGGVGLSYTFGSIYNNIVNPRFGGGSNFIIFE